MASAPRDSQADDNRPDLKPYRHLHSVHGPLDGRPEAAPQEVAAAPREDNHSKERGRYRLWHTPNSILGDPRTQDARGRHQ